VVERLREPTAIALAKGDNSLKLGKARLMQTRRASKGIDLLVPKHTRMRSRTKGSGRAPESSFQAASYSF
jgi:hypothetical protein